MDLDLNDKLYSPEQSILDLSYEELVSKCEDLRQENEMWRKRVLAAEKGPKAKKVYNQRPYDFSRFKKRHVAFRFAYLGWDYQGFASQENTSNTIEEHVFNAFQKAKLIEGRDSCRYSRCGRTDKGVSAFGQVIALDVRSNLASGLGFVQDAENADLINTVVEQDGEKKEIDYVKLLNKNLPSDIRVLSYAPVDVDFNARFHCKTRTYKYFFPSGKLDIQKMHTAAQKLVGEKDFRNFCKVDVGNNVNHFIRKVVSFDVRRINDSGSGDDMCEMQVTGLAFLWHQVRCMAAVLLLVGLGVEQPEVLDYLLDVERCPRRPQYMMASELPLVLFDCEYDGIKWNYVHDYHDHNVHSLKQMWTRKVVQSSMLSSMLTDLRSRASSEATGECDPASISAILPGYTKGAYKALADRAVCEGFDRHMEKLAAKRLKLEERYAEKVADETC